MMKNKSMLLALVLSLVSMVTYAQDEMFKVLASKGGNKLQTSGTSEWKAVFVGKKLAKGDKITVGDNGYLGLAHSKTGKTIELKKAGTYEVSKLAGEVAAQNASTSTKYANYLAGELGKTGGEDMAKNRYKYMSVTGSVERGSGVAIIAPKKVDALNNDLSISWNAEPGDKTYVVEVTNLFGDVVSTTETKETSAVIKLDNKKDKNYVTRVSLKDNANYVGEISIQYPSNDKSVELNKQLTELKAQLSEETALNKMILASFYEDNKLFLEAMQSYEAAVKLQPDVEDFKLAYNQFLERTGLLKPAADK
jgi:hypothetical protein